MWQALSRIFFCLLVFQSFHSIALEGLSHEFSMAAWLAGTSRGLVESPANPHNRVLLIPQRDLRAELRPDLKLSYRADSLVLRPRWLASDSRVDERPSSEATSKLEWSDAYLSITASDHLTLTYGLQNFQWGPTEVGSPSNRIFRETVQMRDVLYVVKGRHLLRLNFSPNGGWTEVFMAELSDNGDQEPIANAAFERKALLKSELADAGGANYAGVVLGVRERSGGWLGEYFNYEVVDGLSFYADASHERGSRAWYPQWNAQQMATVLTCEIRTKAPDQIGSIPPGHFGSMAPG